jgi:hypothetical protein
MYNVYLLSAEIDGSTLYKIGYTRRNPQVRLKELKTGNASDMSVISSYKSEWGTKIEAFLHRKYSSKKVNREWFRLEDEDVLRFNEDCKSIHNNFELLSKTTYYEQYGKF